MVCVSNSLFRRVSDVFFKICWLLLHKNILNLKQILNNLPKEAKDKHIENKKYFDKLKKKQPKNLDYVMQELHDCRIQKNRLFKMCQLLQNNRAIIYFS